VAGNGAQITDAGPVSIFAIGGIDDETE
jgi:hypothetical protein